MLRLSLLQTRDIVRECLHVGFDPGKSLAIPPHLRLRRFNVPNPICDETCEHGHEHPRHQRLDAENARPPDAKAGRELGTHADYSS